MLYKWAIGWNEKGRISGNTSRDRISAFLSGLKGIKSKRTSWKWVYGILKDGINVAIGGCIWAMVYVALHAGISLSVLPVFMGHHFTHDGFIIQSDMPVTIVQKEAITKANDIIAASELYREGMMFRGYLCQNEWLFRVASLFERNARGIYFQSTDRIYINMSNISSNTDFARVLAHEATHSMTRNHLKWRVVLLPKWVSEGYAEHIAHSSWSERAAMREIQNVKNERGNEESYHRYRLLVSYALDGWDMPLEKLLNKAPAIGTLEDSIKARNASWIMAQLTEKPAIPLRRNRFAHDLTATTSIPASPYSAYRGESIRM